MTKKLAILRSTTSLANSRKNSKLLKVHTVCVHILTCRYLNTNPSHILRRMTVEFICSLIHYYKWKQVPNFLLLKASNSEDIRNQTCY